MLMLETDFDLGRRLVLDALADNRETQIPVAGPLRLLSPWLWGVAGADSLPSVALPERPAEPETLVALSDQLVGHPAFSTWSARSEATLQAAEEAQRHPRWDLEVWVRRLAGDLFGEPMVAGVFGQRLAAMSEWLQLAGDEKRAAMALAAAEAMGQKPPQEQPFLRAIIRRDLEFALQSLRATGES